LGIVIAAVTNDNEFVVDLEAKQLVALYLSTVALSDTDTPELLISGSITEISGLPHGAACFICVSE